VATLYGIMDQNR